MSEYNIQEDDDEIVVDLGVFFCDLWRGLKKFWWIFLIICSLMAGLNYGRAALSYSPSYESKASFTVSTQMGYDESNTSYGFYYNQSTAEQLSALFPYVLQSDVMTGLVEEEIGGAVSGSVSATAIPESNLFTIKAVSSDPMMAKMLLEATIKHIPDVTRYVIGETKLNIIQPVTTPEEPFNKPDYRRQAVLGALVGVVMCIVILACYALFRKTIRKEEDFREVLNIKCLGMLPFIKFKEHNKEIDQTVSILNERSGRGFREANRSLVLKIQRELDQRDQKVLMVTSTIPNEGKSTAAMNLALGLNKKDKKVLLVDMDFRNPTLKGLLKEEKKMNGLVPVLEGKLDPKEALIETKQGIYFTGAEDPVKNVSQLLTKPYLRSAFETYRKDMDYIIVDVPPCEVMADSSIIARVCDDVLYVIRQDEAKQNQILDGLQKMMDCGIPILGGILNGVEDRLSGYGYHYGYGKYGRYGRYGYGKYGEKDEEK